MTGASEPADDTVGSTRMSDSREQVDAEQRTARARLLEAPDRARIVESSASTAFGNGPEFGGVWWADVLIGHRPAGGSQDVDVERVIRSDGLRRRA